MAIPEGHLAQHMAVHVGEMNLAAPLCAVMLSHYWPKSDALHLGLATALQVLLLWGWHTPVAFAAAAGSPALMMAMHVSLFAAALWFWTSVINHIRLGSWIPVAALLITGKLFCLLGVLLTFAPRTIYAFGGLAGQESARLLADQQLAGLLMLAACPVAYVGTAIIAARRWLAAMRRAPGWNFRKGAA